MKIEYKIRGITLTAGELADIDRYYEAACTAQYMLDSYDQVRTEKQALELGYEVRRRMSKYDFSEQEAIDNVLSELDEIPDEVEVMLTDLTLEAQKMVMQVLGIDSPAEGNYDVFPLFTVCKPDDDEDGSADREV